MIRQWAPVPETRTVVRTALRYLAAVGVAVAVVWAADGLEAYLQGVRFSIPIAVTALLALALGAGPGTVCAVLVGLGIWYFQQPPRGSFAVDGREVPRLAAYFLASASVLFAIGLLDRTRRRLATKAEQFRALAENSPEVIARFDRELRHVYVNEYGARVYGKSRDEILGRTNAELGMPADKVAFWRERFEQVFATGRQQTVDFEFDGPTFGHQFFSSLFVPETDPAGRVASILAITRDVSELRRTLVRLREERAKFRSIFEQGAIGVGRVAFGDARWLDANDALCRMLGRSRHEMRRTPWPEMTHPEDLELDLVPFRKMAAGDLESYTVEKRFLHADGHPVWAQLTLSLVRDASGRPAYEIAFVEDIGDRKRAQAELEEVDRRKNEFLAMLSHELRNPLAPIKNSLYVLQRAAPGGPQAVRAREVIDRQVVQLTRLVDDLLDVTRISRGKVRLQKERLDLCALVQRTAEDHRSIFGGLGVRLDVGGCGAPLHADGDPARLAQVVGNLLTNAAKFTPRGGRVQVSVEREGGAGLIRIRDDGAGIEPGLLERLFEPFVQADATLDRSKGGLGLGLALVKGLAELHGGAVTARSEGPGKGAEFVVRLPVEPAPRREAAHVGEESPGCGTKTLRVLLIEDNADAALSLKEALEFGGHRVEIATSGFEGLAKVQAFFPDVVLCDIGLPGIDGFEVARRMRADPAVEAPLVALSGYAGPDDFERSRAAGFVRHLAKPPDLDVLERTLCDVWSSSRPRPAGAGAT